MRKRYTAAFKAQVVIELLKEEQTVNQLAAKHGVHPTQLRDWKKQVLDGLPNLFDQSPEAARQAAAQEREREELFAQIGRLTTQLAWLKKNLASNLPRSERVALVDWADRELPLNVQAELLSLNRSGLYYQPVPPSPDELWIKRRIDEIYTQWPFYGSRRITVELQKELTINRKAVQRHMREMGLAGICPGPNLSQRRQEHAIFPYLLRNLTATRPNHVWGVDITYVRLRGGWLYLVAVLDWYSRYVVSWELDQTLEMPFVLEAVDRALAQATPTIWNSDQGSHFTSPQYIDRLKQAEVQISMDGKGRALDNIFTERLWRTVKYEEVYLHDYAHPKEARQQLAHYFEFYNYQRPHQALDYRTPAQLYFGQEARLN
jgi:putative transposase